MDHAPLPGLMSKHRIEALTDGIFAVTMTLLVIDLRLPESLHGAADPVLRSALAGLLPTFISWLISFFVLAIFWVAHHRLFHYVRHVDQPLLWLTVLMLAGASLMPFATTLNNQHSSPLSQWMYAATMGLMALSAMGTAAYLYRHPDLCGPAFGRGVYVAALVRSGAVLGVAVLSGLASHVLPAGMASMAFMLLWLSRPLGAAAARRFGASASAPAPLQ